MTGASKQRSYDGDYMVEGRKAEELVLAFLKDNPAVVGVDDWRALRVVHEADIDFAIRTIDGRVTLAEVKSDSHLGVTGNVLFEALRINHTCSPDRAVVLGWSARSPATYFMYYAPSVKALYQCRTDDLRRCCQEYTKVKRQDVRTVWVNTDNIKSTLNILIPWEYCKAFFTVYDLSLFEL